MRFRFIALASNKNLKGVEAALHFPRYTDTVEAEVRAYSLDEYIELYDDRKILRVIEDTGDLIVLEVTAEFDHDKIYRQNDETCCMTTYDAKYDPATNNWKLSHQRYLDTPMERKYVYLRVYQTYTTIEGLTCNPVNIKGAEATNMIEAVSIFMVDPFPHCDVSKLELLNICATDFGVCSTSLKRVHKLYGPSAFASLKRLRGNYSELELFFSLFNNTKFECIVVVDSDSLPIVEGLSIDELCFRPVHNKQELKKKYSEVARMISYGCELSTSKAIALDHRSDFRIQDNEELTELYGVINLTDRVVATKAYTEYSYRYSVGDLTKRNSFKLAFTFDRSDRCKNARF